MVATGSGSNQRSLLDLNLESIANLQLRYAQSLSQINTIIGKLQEEMNRDLIQKRPEWVSNYRKLVFRVVTSLVFCIDGSTPLFYSES